ncbi:hypothetical protein ACTXT7_003143 [Hymenolepis weldensis]
MDITMLLEYKKVNQRSAGSPDAPQVRMYHPVRIGSSAQKTNGCGLSVSLHSQTPSSRANACNQWQRAYERTYLARSRYALLSLTLT